MNSQKVDFLPISKEDMKNRGWDCCDFILISGDAYVDHPTFAAAIISRVLEKGGFKVGIIPQPDWRSIDNFRKLGEPRLGWLISPGNLDSMVANYSANKNRRKKDSFSPGGVAGKRPDRAAIVYSSMARQAYKGKPVILGGVEASMRRFTHYDYWADKLRKPLLLDAKADMLLFGMGELAIIELANRLEKGHKIENITDIAGTVYRASKLPKLSIGQKITQMPSFETCVDQPDKYGRAFVIQSEQNNPYEGAPVSQKCAESYVIQNPPMKPLSSSQMDDVYDLPYRREVHPIYEDQGGVPAISEVKFSITRNRGCYGRCSFCALTFHQGEIVTTRSNKSVLKEAELITQMKDFKGYIHDIGGPTANFTGPSCEKQRIKGPCQNKSCIGFGSCKNLVVDHSKFLELLRSIRKLEGIKKVFIRSGLRFDTLMLEKDDSFFNELCEHHISGQLKVAPEHISDNVLRRLNKPSAKVYLSFVEKFKKWHKENNKKQYIIPYLIASHPGAKLEDAIELALWLKETHFTPEQVQDFYPTPGTLSTVIYYTGKDPYNGKDIYVAKKAEERRMQRALLQFNNPKNFALVRKALVKAGCSYLIGRGNKCLVPPGKGKKR